ncbi:FkbM family methyltransferase [Azospirillum sp.]|uniref:FkbM family methyltransferase n=1 Tax=Azospirillum sp. TaxID=34012 RepID=UPI003D733110
MTPPNQPRPPADPVVAAGLAAALRAHQAGARAQAAEECRRVLGTAPEEAEAWHLLALAYLLDGAAGPGLACLRRALALAPGRGDVLMNFGRALAEGGRWGEAEAVLERALQCVPGHPEALLTLGNARQMAGRPDAAVAAYEAALRTEPDRTDIRHNLGLALRAAGRVREAEAILAALAARADAAPDLAVELARTRALQGRLGEAEALLRQVLARHPQYLPAAFALGITLSDLGRWVEAEDVFHTITRLDPNHAEAHQARGALLKILARPTEAVLCQERALGLRRDFPQATLSLGAVLVDCGRLAEAVEADRWCLAMAPDLMEARSNLLLALCQSPGIPRADLDAEHRAWGARHGAGAAAAAHTNRADPDKRLRVGYVSADFRTHSVAYFLEPVLAAHDRGRIEVVCYDNSPHRDATTGRLQASADLWRPIRGLDGAAAAQLVREDGIDILIDLSGHTAGNRLDLFALKPAPVQLTWLGYPESTGLTEIAGKITDAVACPAGERFASEEPVRLPGGFHCYRPPDDAPDLVPPPMLEAGHVTFGAFHDVPKLSPETIAAWGEILRRIPRSRLLLKAQQFADAAVRDRVRAMLAVAGVAADRVDLRGRVGTTRAHLGLYNRVDIALDAFPYNGTTTTCEALWMGVPVVAVRGDRPASRMSASLLEQLGLPELVAGDVEGYVRLACALAGRMDLPDLRAGMRARFANSTLGNPAAFVRGLEDALRRVWRGWCAGRPEEGAEPPPLPRPAATATPPVPPQRASPFYTPPPSCQIPDLDGIYRRVFGERGDGTFVEVGAFDGETYSNTVFLADIGWRGLYIEPVPAFAAACARRHRHNPDVRVVACAAGAEAGEAVLSVGDALSTLSGEQMALYRMRGWDTGVFSGKRLTVPVRPLDAVLREHRLAPGFELLVVDVEGGEDAVFDGFDLEVWRPRMLIVELHDRNPAYQGVPGVADRHAAVRRHIGERGYEACYADAVNTVFLRRP